MTDITFLYDSSDDTEQTLQFIFFSLWFSRHYTSFFSCLWGSSCHLTSQTESNTHHYRYCPIDSNIHDWNTSRGRRRKPVWLFVSLLNIFVSCIMSLVCSVPLKEWHHYLSFCWVTLLVRHHQTKRVITFVKNWRQICLLYKKLS